MNQECWNLWGKPRRRVGELALLRYGLAVILPLAGAYVVHRQPALAGVPFHIFLAVIVLVAVFGGLAPAVVATGLASVLIRFLFVEPVGSLFYRGDVEGMKRMGGFILLALISASFVAGLRRQVQQLRDSEERYRLLADTASDAIIVIDEHGEILYLNPIAERLFGAESRQMLGRNLGELLPEHGYREQVRQMQRELDTRKAPVAVQLPGLHRSGEHLLLEMTMGTSSHRGRSLFTAIMREVKGKLPGHGPR